MVPTLIVAIVQAHFQMAQAVYEHRSRALADLIQVVHGDATHFLARTYNLESQIQESDYSVAKDREQVTEQVLKFYEDYSELIGKANLSITIVNSVFNTTISTVDLSATSLAAGQQIRVRDAKSPRLQDFLNEQQATVSALTQARQAAFQKLIIGLQREISKLHP